MVVAPKSGGAEAKFFSYGVFRVGKGVPWAAALLMILRPRQGGMSHRRLGPSQP
jgi:hypothetical protein